MSSVQRKTSDVFRAGFLTVDGTLTSNNSQLYFRPLQYPLQTVSGEYYSLSPAQQNDPSIRINQWSANGTFEGFGYLYDTQFNPLPPGQSLLLAGGSIPFIIVYSQDNGITWRASDNARTTFDNCLALAYNGFVWVAGGDATSPQKLAYSGNGSTWTPSTSANALIGAGGQVNAIAANRSLWIAGATSATNRIIYSYDSIHWYPSATGNIMFDSAGSCNALASNGSLFVAGGSGTESLAYSYDGITWSPSFNGKAVLTTVSALAWNGNLWIAGGTGTDKMAYSYDGIGWNDISNTFGTSCNAVAWSGSQWVAGGSDPSGNTLLYSYDGFNWTRANGTNLFTDCYAVAWKNGSWIAGGSGTDSLLVSEDGINWQIVINAEGLLLTCYALANGKTLPNTAALPPDIPTNPIVLMGGNDAVIASSVDGITWSPILSAGTVFPDATCYALLWDGSIWVAGLEGSPFTLGYSYDGINWNGSPSGSSLLTSYCDALASDGSLWLAGGFGISNRVLTSRDGITWSANASANSVFDTSACFALAYNGSQWVGGANSSTNRIGYSADGSANWFGSASGNALFPEYVAGFAWNGQIWVAVGDYQNTGIAYSSNGINWLPAATPPDSDYFNTVAYNGTLFVAGGGIVLGSTATATLAYSYDGSTWFPSTSGSAIFTVECTAVTWTGTLWIATGDGTTTSAYSYNGIEWIPTSNGLSVQLSTFSVAANRPLPTAGVALPTPVLYPTGNLGQGPVVYSTGLNSLVRSTTISINDISGIVDISGNVSINRNLYVGQDISASSAHIDDISTNTISVRQSIYALDISANSIFSVNFNSVNLDVLNISGGDISANSIFTRSFNCDTINTITLNVTDISGGDISANSVVAIGAIASSLALNQRGIIDSNITINPGSEQWDSDPYTPDGEGLKYSTFLVNANTAIFANSEPGDCSGVVRLQIIYGPPGEILGSAKYIPYSFPDNIGFIIPISCSFVISKDDILPILVRATIINSNTRLADFVPNDTNNYTSVDIIGIA